MTALNLCNKQNVKANETIVPYITFLIKNISVFFSSKLQVCTITKYHNHIKKENIAHIDIRGI